jgi:hypothetical protein
MLSFLGDRLNRRKRQLFACACVRRVWPFIEDSTCRRALIVAERFADGLASEEEREQADEAVAHGDGRGTPYGPADLAATFAIISDVDFADVDTVLRHPAVNAARFAAEASGKKPEEKEFQAALVRDIAGNPFRSPPCVDPAWQAWNDSTVVKLAKAVYEHRPLPDGTLDRNRLAVLADALEEAGCTDAELLAHLRSPGPHVRGCFAVDAVLGKG